MGVNKTIAQNTIFLYIRMLLVMGVSLYTSRLILQALGVEDFGIYNVVGGIVTMFSFLNGSLGGATSRYLTYALGKQQYDELNKVFNVALVNHILISILIVILSETIGLWFLNHKMVIPESRQYAAYVVYQVSILSSVLSLLQVPYNATIIAYEDMKVYAYVGVFEVLLKLGAVLLLFYSSNDRLIIYAILLCFVQMVITLFYIIYCTNRYTCCKIKLYRDKALYKEMFGYAGADLIGNISVLAQGQGLNILLNMFFGPAVNAARAIAYQVQGAITMFSSNFLTAVKPQIIKSFASGDTSNMFKLVEYSSCLSFYLLLLVSLPICLESSYILNLWLGDYPNHTVNFLILAVILCLIQTIKIPRTTIFHATGNLKLVNSIVGGVLCAAFPLAYIFLRFGLSPESVFVAAIITMLVSELCSVLILKKYVDFSVKDYFKKVHLRCFVVFTISIAISYPLYNLLNIDGFNRLIVTLLITSSTIILVSLLIGVDRDMRSRLFHFMKQLIIKNN